MRYPIETIKEWANQGQAISPHLAMELVKDNLELRNLVLQVIELISANDPILLRRMDTNALELWSEKASHFLRKIRDDE